MVFKIFAYCGKAQHEKQVRLSSVPCDQEVFTRF